MNRNTIEKSAILRAPRKRVWEAVSDYKEFAKWFGIEFESPFEPNARLAGRVTNPGYEHLRAEIVIGRVKPEWLLSWRWHPSAIDAERDYSNEPMTLVTFELLDVDGGTRLNITETGFDHIPEERRQDAYSNNEAGWTKQIESITRFVSRAA